MPLIGSSDSYGINYTGKYNFLHNDHGNKSHSVNKKSQQKKSKIKLFTCILGIALMDPNVQHTIQIKCYSGIKCNSQYQQRNLCYLQKKRIGSIRFTIMMGNQDLCVIWNILRILKILMIKLWLMCPPLMLENIWLWR